MRIKKNNAISQQRARHQFISSTAFVKVSTARWAQQPPHHRLSAFRRVDPLGHHQAAHRHPPLDAVTQFDALGAKALPHGPCLASASGRQFEAHLADHRGLRHSCPELAAFRQCPVVLAADQVVGLMIEIACLDQQDRDVRFAVVHIYLAHLGQGLRTFNHPLVALDPAQVLRRTRAVVVPVLGFARPHSGIEYAQRLTCHTHHIRRVAVTCHAEPHS